MRHLIWLSLIALWLVPSQANAARPPPPVQRYCSDTPLTTNVTAVRQPVRCLAGYVVRTTARGMQVRLFGLGRRIVVFRFDTEFQSNSALGTFDGVQPGDFVCVTVIKPALMIRALLVVMDTGPFPCHMHRVRPADAGSPGQGTNPGNGTGPGSGKGTRPTPTPGPGTRGGGHPTPTPGPGTGSGQGTGKPRKQPTPHPRKPPKHPAT